MDSIRSDLKVYGSLMNGDEGKVQGVLQLGGWMCRTCVHSPFATKCFYFGTV